jgi:hypothetical protein
VTGAMPAESRTDNFTVADKAAPAAAASLYSCFILLKKSHPTQCKKEVETVTPILYTEIYDELYSFIQTLPVISTHSHHEKDAFHTDLNLDSLLKKSYVYWCGAVFDSTPESRRLFLEKVRFNSYFIWLEKALAQIYHFDDPITAGNWDRVSGLISAANKNGNHHLDLLTHWCKYEKIILDAYWNPGSDNNHPDLFAPTFRINMFLYGYSRKAADHNGNNPEAAYGIKTKDIDEYISCVRDIIVKKKREGCIALKSALAYDRGLNFSQASRERAQAALTAAEDAVTPEDIKAFGDYVFFEICKTAAELGLPVQCHTGLGALKETNAMQMREVIEKNPDTRFVLFHGGYPWLDDVLALTHFYKNVYPDICWLPIISTSAAERMIIELIEVSTIDKICWGCDTWTAEESAGALLAMRHALAGALSKMAADGYFSINSAKKAAENILYNNAKAIYKL